MKLLKILNINWMRKKHENTYTQREWDRTVGIGKVPPEYQHPDDKEWSGQEDSNLRSPAPKAGALPD